MKGSKFLHGKVLVTFSFLHIIKAHFYVFFSLSLLFFFFCSARYLAQSFNACKTPNTEQHPCPKTPILRIQGYVSYLFVY